MAGDEPTCGCGRPRSHRGRCSERRWRAEVRTGRPVAPLRPPLDQSRLTLLQNAAREHLPLSAALLEHLFRGVAEVGTQAFGRADVLAAVILQARQQVGPAPDIEVSHVR